MAKWIVRRKRLVSFLLIACLLNGTIGCYYYKYKLDTQPTMMKLDELKNSPNFLIVHQGGMAWALASVTVDRDNQLIYGRLYDVPLDHRMYEKTKPTPGVSNHYIKKHKNGQIASPGVINEVHLYTHDVELYKNMDVSIPLSAIEKVEIYDPHTGATTASFVFGILGAGVAVLTIIIIVILLTKSSCPFVYVNNGESYVFAGEVFGGAVFKPIERDDYLTLPKINSNDKVEIVIANKLRERQFINNVGLVQVAHPTGTKVLADRHGNIHRISDEVRMTKSEINGIDVTAMLKEHDSINFLFDQDTGDDYFNDVVLTFPKSGMSKEGHLVMHAKNSLWGDYVFGEFTKLFGARYMPWVEKQNKSDGKEHKDWALDQGMAMKVYVEQNGEWNYVDHAELVGPLAYRDLVIPIDLSKHTGNEVKIRLSAGFMMWDLDYVGLDLSDDSGIESTYLAPSVALTHDGKDAKALLASRDNDYLEQLEIGDELSLTFDIKKKTDVDYTYVFHTRGYYNHVREYGGFPDVPTLLTFKGDGRFSKFSKEKHDELNELMKVAEVSVQVP